MNPETSKQMVRPVTTEPVTKTPHPVNQVTPLSKYLAMVIFILMPFVGGYVGYRLAPEKVVEVPVPVLSGENEIVNQNSSQSLATDTNQEALDDTNISESIQDEAANQGDTGMPEPQLVDRNQSPEKLYKMFFENSGDFILGKVVPVALLGADLEFLSKSETFLEGALKVSYNDMADGWQLEFIPDANSAMKLPQQIKIEKPVFRSMDSVITNICSQIHCDDVSKTYGVKIKVLNPTVRYQVISPDAESLGNTISFATFDIMQ